MLTKAKETENSSIANLISEGGGQLLYHASPKEQSLWTIESVNKDSIDVGLTNRQHYMKCRVTYQDKLCDLKIIDWSKELMCYDPIYSEHRLHSNTTRWARNFSEILKKSFLRISVLKFQNKLFPLDTEKSRSN